MALPSPQDTEPKTISFPFKGKSDRVQQIASKVLSTLFAFPKKSKVAKERLPTAKEQAQEKEVIPSPTEKLNQLIAVNNLFCQLLEAEGILGITLDRTGNVLDVSENVKTLLGYEALETFGRSGYSYLHPDDIERARHDLNAKWDEKKGIVFQLRCKSKKTGEWVKIRFNVIQSPSMGGGKYFLLGFIVN